MKENEFDFISSAIKSVMNKEVKKIKKLYQAKIDGDDASIFHSKCDNIPYTLTIIKSPGNRRFGGFITQTFDQSNSFKTDGNAFLFSLDKKKIYQIKRNDRAVWSGKDYGPVFGRNNGGCFGNSHDICIYKGYFHTYEFLPDSASYEYSGDKEALSECGNAQKEIPYNEYEVFQIIF